jgi:hypothetical protein
MATHRDAVSLLTNRLILMVVDELSKPETQQRVARNVVDPMVKTVAGQVMPYALLGLCVLVAILVMTLLTFAFSLLFYLKSTNVR